MTKIILSVDSTADYMLSEIKERDIKYITMPYVMDGKPVYEIFNSSKEFYSFFKKIEEGVSLTTTQLNTAEMKEYFERLLLETEGDIIHYPLSSGLSGTCQCAIDAAEEINEKLKSKADKRKIYVVDSKGATQTICHLVDYAVKLRKEGKSAEEIVKLTEEFRDRQHVYITVKDLDHLKRGGRISGISAAIGTMLSIKPIIIINNEGKLVIHSKEMGMKKAFTFIINAIKTYGEEILEQTIIIGHTGAHMYEYAEELAQKIKYEIKCKVEIKHIGSIIGAHLGPDSVALVFIGKPRLSK